VRLSLGSGFAPPVAAIRSLQEVVEGAEQCTPENLRQYYREHGAGRLQIGHGQLSNTTALTDVLVRALDEDQNGTLTRAELAKAEAALRKLDTNDDELIGVGELVPNATYPGSAAANALPAVDGVDISLSGDRGLILQWSSAPGTSVWQLAISDQIGDRPLKVASRARCESWSVGN
ncbi:MAG: hypothetical protein B7Z55_19395, partial [Planctomycetales bacterium 12-60-4]